MRTIDQLLDSSRLGWQRPLRLVAACLLCACATSTAKRHAPIESQDETGFTITERVRFSAKVRSEFGKALRLLEDEQYESGIELLRGVTTSAPNATTAHIDLGIAYRLVGDLERAEASIKSALELNPRHPVAHNELGIVYRRTGRFEETWLRLYRAVPVAFPRPGREPTGVLNRSRSWRQRRSSRRRVRPRAVPRNRRSE